MTELSIRLLEAMSAHSLTQQELADAVGCSDVAINKILKGHTKRSRLMPAIAAVLNVDLRWLQGSREGVAASADNPEIDLPDEVALRGMFRSLVEELPKKAGISRRAATLASRLPYALAAPQKSGIEPSSAPCLEDANAIRRSSCTPHLYRENPSQTADRLAKAMAARSISQKKLARAAGCSQVTISKILSGDIKESRLLPDIASALGVSHDWLGAAERCDEEIAFARIKIALPKEAVLQMIFYGLLLQMPAGASLDDIAQNLADGFLSSLEAIKQAHRSEKRRSKFGIRLSEA